jgi:hypothetical protein
LEEVEEENIKEKKKAEEEIDEEEKEEGDVNGEEKEEEEEPEEEEEEDEDEDEVVDICVDDTQSAAAVILGEEDQHFPYSLSGHGHCGSSVSDPTSDLAPRASTTAATSSAAGEYERASCTAQSHIEELKEEGLCVSNPPHAFPSPSPFAFPYTSDSLSATPMAARSSDMKEFVGALNGGASIKIPDTQSSSTQYTQPRLLKRDNEGLSAAQTCLVATPVAAWTMPTTDAPAPGTAAGSASSASESFPIPTSQFALSPVWATKGSETGGSYAGDTLTSSFGAGE